MSGNESGSSFPWRTVITAGLMLIVGLAIGLGIMSIFLLRGSGSEATALEATTSVADAASVSAETVPDTNDPPPPPLSIITNTPTLTPIPTETPTPGPTDTPTLTPLPTETPLPTNTPLPTPTPTREGPQARAIEDAAMLAGPGTIGRINSWIPTGNDVILLGISEDGFWYHIISQFGVEGWARASYFDIIRGNAASLPVSDFISTATVITPTPGTVAPGGTPVPGSTTVPTGSTSAEAFYNYIEASSASNLDETWRGEIHVYVPTGHTYEFQFGDVLRGVTKIIDNQDGSDTYSLDISGMACGLPYLNTLIVLQGTNRMVVKNFFTGSTGNLYLQYDC